MTCGPWIAGTTSLSGGLAVPTLPGCALIFVGAPTEPLDCAGPADKEVVDPPPEVLEAPPHAAAATRMAIMTRTFFIRRPPVRVFELPDQTLDVAAGNNCRRAAGQKPRHRRRRTPGALGRKLHRGGWGQGRIGRTQRRRQDEPAQGAGG